ncbi:MAG TPA: hypothetical protein VF552_00480 [Allosphingosinicella sp.]|jgi:hypothetical protein
MMGDAIAGQPLAAGGPRRLAGEMGGPRPAGVAGAAAPGDAQRGAAPKRDGKSRATRP